MVEHAHCRAPLEGQARAMSRSAVLGTALQKIAWIDGWRTLKNSVHPTSTDPSSMCGVMAAARWRRRVMAATCAGSVKSGADDTARE